MVSVHKSFSERMKSSFLLIQQVLGIVFAASTVAITKTTNSALIYQERQSGIKVQTKDLLLVISLGENYPRQLSFKLLCPDVGNRRI